MSDYGGNRPLRVGEGLLINPSMAVWAEKGSKFWGAYENDWYNHMHEQARKHVADLAEPCIWENKLCLRGGLKPRGEQYAPAGSQYILAKNGVYNQQ